MHSLLLLLPILTVSLTTTNSLKKSARALKSGQDYLDLQKLNRPGDPAGSLHLTHELGSLWEWLGSLPGTKGGSKGLITTDSS